MTDATSIRAMLDQLALAYGGLDAIAVTAGIFVPPDTAGRIRDEQWALTFAINVTGAYLVADEAAELWRAQGLPAQPGAHHLAPTPWWRRRAALAYDTSKAAANHLVRELAVELAPLVRVNGVAPATVVQGSAMFPRDRVIASLAKYKIAYARTSDRGAARQAGAVLRRPHATQAADQPADQAEAFFLLSRAACRRPPARSSPSTAGCTRRSCARGASGRIGLSCQAGSTGG